MEEFNKKAKAQEDLGKKIQTLLTNARKDLAKRKTQNWRSKRAEQLQEFWNEIQRNHEELKILGPTLRTTHDYFEVNYFDQLKALHEDAKKYLESVETSPDVDMEQEARIRRQLFRLQKISTALTKIKSDWRSIMELHEEIHVHEREFEDKYFADEMYEKTEEKSEVVVEKLKEKIQSPSAHQQEKPNIQLPQIKFPTFSGNYEDWPTFHDLFSKVIHKNTSLSNIEKMQYLKTYIKDEPSRVIQHLQITENNYETAWKLLAKRFSNPRIQEESSEKLKKLHDTTKECLEALNNLDIQTDTWGPILTKIVSQKWDTETNRLYEQSLTKPHDMQEFEKMMEQEKKIVKLQKENCRKTKTKFTDTSKNGISSSHTQTNHTMPVVANLAPPKMHQQLIPIKEAMVQA
ncbi:golgin subfamily A member 6-like protein 25 [Zophobas morio]|uniref:golgin subfamily A member 6-like protein 25 n=1 Tax=Zophobas morio TaxID=2755281 RepID=UPI003082CFC3